MKTDKRKKGSLLSMITRNYLRFSFTVLGLLLGFGWFVNRETEKQFYIPTPEKLQKYRHYLLEGEYEKFPIEKFLGKKGGFSVLNGDGKVIYSSDEQMPKCFTRSELSVIVEIGEEEKILISKTEHTCEAVEKMEQYLLLDSDYNILVDCVGMDTDRLSEK